jgi:hypothetical protein
MSAVRGDRADLKRIGRGLLIAVPLVGFVGQPLLRYASPAYLWVAGFSLAIGAAIVTAEHTRRSVPWVLFGLVCGVASFFALAAISDEALTNAYNNDLRCLAIQRDMLSAQPKRADGPDLFQALGCRPQGAGDVYALRGSPADHTPTARQLTP